MSTGPIVVTPAARAAALDLGGEDITVLASGAQTAGYEVFLQVGREGSGPPPHHHPWDEGFFVLRGEVAFGADGLDDSLDDGRESTVGPGTFVHVPAGTTHWFRVGAGGAEMLSFTSRDGASGFFTAISRDHLEEGAGLAEIVRIAAAHGATIVPPG